MFSADIKFRDDNRRHKNNIKSEGVVKRRWQDIKKGTDGAIRRWYISEWAAINNGADQRNDGHATKLMQRDAGFYFSLK